MVLLDTNIFVIDRFFPGDSHYEANKKFIKELPQLKAGFSIFSLLELAGIASFNLSAAELQKWLLDFGSVYPIRILDPYDLQIDSAKEWYMKFLRELMAKTALKMTFGDAVLLREAEGYQVEYIISWNKKHFNERTTIPVINPEEFLNNSPSLA